MDLGLEKVKNNKNCDFRNHIRLDPNSTHRVAQRSCEDLGAVW